MSSSTKAKSPKKAEHPLNQQVRKGGKSKAKVIIHLANLDVPPWSLIQMSPSGGIFLRVSCLAETLRSSFREKTCWRKKWSLLEKIERVYFKKYILSKAEANLGSMRTVDPFGSLLKSTQSGRNDFILSERSVSLRVNDFIACVREGYQGSRRRIVAVIFKLNLPF